MISLTPSLVADGPPQDARFPGLTGAGAREQLRRHGPNAVLSAPAEGWPRVLLRQFRGLIVAVLAAAAAVSFAFGDRAEGYTILVVILINALIGFCLEWNAQTSMAALRRLGRVTARVLRDAEVRAVPSDEVALGDVLLIEAGEVVAADATLFAAQRLQINEATLTGESMPVRKTVAPGEPGGRIFKGTAVVAGTGRATVTGIGAHTELGSIARMVEQAKHTATPLETKLAYLARQLVLITAALVGVFVVIGLLRGAPARDLIMTAIVLAVAAIPEGMSIVATLALAHGMLRLARRNVLVKRLAAVETLGSTDVIFTDKTGTLTENRMVARTVWLPGARIDFPPGEPARPSFSDAAHRLLLRAAVLCNDATYSPANVAAALGDPLEVALLALAHQHGLDVAAVRAATRLAERPFDPDTRLMATLHRHTDGQAWVAVKGAPEAVLERCAQEQATAGPQPLSPAARAEWSQRGEQLAATGLRVLGVAYRVRADESQTDWVDGLIWLGLVGFLDPPRAEVIPAIEACRRAGIRILMVTGDHPATALTVAQQVHLTADAGATVVTGAQLRELSLPGADSERLLHAAVFARVSPAQKLDLISLYQRQGHVVAMIGDGVNDAPALKKADIGVAMGLRGTQVAGEAAALVLRDDSFASIVAAVEQGRITFINIRRFVLYLVSCNLSELLVVTTAGSLVAGAGLLPLQILFLNLITDVFPALALSVGKGDPRVMERGPQDPRAPVMRARDWRLAVAYATLMTAVLLVGDHLARAQAGLSPAAANTALFYALAAAQLLHVFNMAGARARLRDNDVLRDRLVWLALTLCTGLLLLTYFQPLLRAMLGIEALPPIALVFILAPAAIVLVLGRLLGRTIDALHRRSPLAASATPLTAPLIALRRPA